MTIRIEMTSLIAPPGSAIVSVMGTVYAAETIVPLQALAVNPVTLAALLLEELALMPDSTQEPLPMLDIVLNEPVPDVVL